MKKIISVCLLALCMNGNVFALSNLTAETDYASEQIKIIGETENENTEVSVFAFNPGKTFSDIESKGAVQNFKKIESEKNKFLYSFKIHDPENNTGWVTCYVKEEGGDYLQVSTYVASKTEINSIIDDILKNGVSSKLEDDIFLNVFEVVNSEMYKKVDKTLLAKRADAYLKGFERTELETDRKAITKLIKQAVITETYNQKINAAYIDEDGKLTDETVYEIDKKDSEFNTNSLEIFNTLLSDEGKEKVINALKGKSFETFEELRETLMKKTMLYGLNNAKELGYAHVSDILTNSNIKFMGVSGIDVSDSEIQKKIALSTKDFETPSELKSFVSDNKNNGSNGTSGGNGSSGGGNKGSSGGFGGASFSQNTVIIPETKDIFDDIASVPWAKTAIESLYKKEIINGKGNRNFDPDGYITREELTKIAAKAFHYEYSDYTVPFEDVDMNGWYAPYVSAAYEKGIITGISETRFGTGEYVTREDLCVIIYRVLGEKSNAAKADFNDYESVSEYARDAVDYMAANGVIGGFEDGTFRPQAPCTRAQAAKIIYEILEEF